MSYYYYYSCPPDAAHKSDLVHLFMFLIQVLYFQMNLRSVFTPEQQRILERFYENGMTNQSKACFQLILQCAQEAKLDFSVVRVKCSIQS